jgi:hypothetical protein
MNNLALSVALATAPSTAFAELRERPRFWFPLLLVVLTTAGLYYWYYSIVDIEWLKDLMYGNDPKFQAMSEEQRAAAMSMTGRNTMRYGSVIGMIIVLPVVYLLEALYMLLAAKVTRLSMGFRQWFSLVSWSAMPGLLTTVVAAILLVLADNTQVSPSVLQPLSLNELVLHVPVDGPGYALFESLNIATFLAWALMIIGVRTWSHRSWSFSTVYVLLPWVVIYAIWAFFAFR